jgi:predicted  nucleic acid-binding Zn-ribbon protein
VSIDQQIADLEQLVRIDAEIKDLSDRAQTEKGDIAGVRSEVGDLERRIAADGERVGEMEKTRNDLMQELRQIAAQIERSRERLGRARNEREVNAAERELDELRKIQRDRDEEVRKLVGLTDEARGSIQDSQRRKGELSGRLEGSLEGSTKTIADLEQQLAVKQTAREEVIRKLPRRLYLRYQSILGRGRTPVAKSHDGTCLGCFVQLPPMLFHQMLSRTEFGECPNCHRIIYYEPKGAAAEADDGAEAGDEAAADQASPFREDTPHPGGEASN